MLFNMCNEFYSLVIFILSLLKYAGMLERLTSMA